MAISYVASATYTSTASSNSFTLNAPAGIQAGDILIALVTWFPGQNVAQMTVTPPTGWTKRTDIFNDGGGYPNQVCILWRQATSSEPASWSGTFSSTFAQARVTVVAAYRGAAGILVDGTSSKGFTTTMSSSYSTATVNNTDSAGWRVVAAGVSDLDGAFTFTTNEVTTRANTKIANATEQAEGLIADSGAAIATGNTSRTVSRNAYWDASCAWIGILQAASGTAASGTMQCTLPSLANQTSFDAYSAAYDASLAATLPPVSFSGDGTGTPAAASGTMASTLPATVASINAATTSSGVMDVTVMPSVNFSAETRVFGIRVITVDADDSRLIKVDSRSVDD